MEEEVWEGCKSPTEVHLLLLFWRALQVKEETRPSWKAVGSKHENHGFFKLLSCSFLPIIFTLRNFRCCLFLGKCFSDASFRQTVVGQGFCLFGCFGVWRFFFFFFFSGFRYHNLPQMISWWLLKLFFLI